VITGTVYVDLRTEPVGYDDSRDRRRLAALDACPDGSRVVIDVGARSFVYDLPYWLRGHADRLVIEVRGTDADAVAKLIRVARAGDWSVVQ
jgi:hypothetical protein